MKCSLKKK